MLLALIAIIGLCQIAANAYLFDIMQHWGHVVEEPQWVYRNATEAEDATSR